MSFRQRQLVYSLSANFKWTVQTWEWYQSSKCKVFWLVVSTALLHEVIILCCPCKSSTFYVIMLFHIQIIQPYPYCFPANKTSSLLPFREQHKKQQIHLFESCLFFSSVPGSCVPGTTACADLNRDSRWIARLCTKWEAQNLLKWHIQYTHAHICARECPCLHIHRDVTQTHKHTLLHNNTVNSYWPCWC